MGEEWLGEIRGKSDEKKKKAGFSLLSAKVSGIKALIRNTGGLPS